MKRRPGKGSVRRPVHIGGNSLFDFVNKALNSVPGESFQEFLVDLQNDRRPEVKNFVAQPEAIEYRNSKGRRSTYVPDRRIEVTNGPNELVEITISSRRDTDHARDREKAGREASGPRGEIYIVKTEKEVPSGAEAANLQLLHAFSSPCYRNARIAKHLMGLLKQRSPLAFIDLITVVSEELQCERGEVCSTVLYLIWHHFLESDLGKLLLIDGVPPRDVLVELPKEEKHV